MKQLFAMVSGMRSAQSETTLTRSPEESSHVVLPPINPQRGAAPAQATQRGSPLPPVDSGFNLLHQRLCEQLTSLLVEQVGSVKIAYKKLDVERTGVVDHAQFEIGLRRFGIGEKPIVGYRSAVELFDGIDQQRRGLLSLASLLGYNPANGLPAVPTAGSCRSQSKKNKKAPKQRVGQTPLARLPHWVAASTPALDRDFELGLSDLESDSPAAKAKRRRLLRERLRDDRKLLRVNEKRKFVGGLRSKEDGNFKLVELQNARVEQALQDQQRARSELRDLQHALLISDVGVASASFAAEATRREVRTKAVRRRRDQEQEQLEQVLRENIL